MNSLSSSSAGRNSASVADILAQRCVTQWPTRADGHHRASGGLGLRRMIVKVLTVGGVRQPAGAYDSTTAKWIDGKGRVRAPLTSCRSIDSHTCRPGRNRDGEKS